MYTIFIRLQKTRTCALAAVIILIAALLAAGCTSAVGSSASQQQPAPGTSAPESLSGERVEVYHFHGNQQCPTCIAVGDLAEETVNMHFKDQLASGRLVFAHVNFELPENTALAQKYGVTGSSLWIGVYDANGFHKQQDLDVWYLIDDKDQYGKHLSGIITKRLNGDLS
jgi:hypothetical protein